MEEKRLVSFHEIGPVTVASVHVTSLVGGMLWEGVTEELLNKVRQAEAVHLLLDFRGAQHVSMEIFSEVLQIDEAVKASGGSMRLCGLRKPIREILETSELDRQLHIEGAVQHALPRYVRFLQQERKEAHGLVDGRNN